MNNKDIDNSKSDNQSESWKFLINVYNDIEADILISFLEINNIKAKKQFTSGSLSRAIVGAQNNVDVYVPGEKLQEAKKILNEYHH